MGEGVSETDSGRQFFAVDLEHEDFKGLVGPFSSREAAERWQTHFSYEGFWANTSGSSSIVPLYGPVEAEDLVRRGRAERERRTVGTSADRAFDESFSSRMGHPGGTYF